METIDLRSDTVTRPTPEMRRAMAEAEVGDDVYGEDPTINRLQEYTARLLGKEAALFVPTGSMGNSVCLLAHAAPGSEVICEARTHIINHELGALAVAGGLLPRVLTGRHGRMDPEDIERAIQPDIYYQCRTGVIALENSHNLAGGTVHDLAYLDAVRAVADRHDLPIHLDGARLFNAAAALGVEARAVAERVDSVMVCLSKGLGAPVGSMVAGTADLIRQARIHRKRLGGGMRQAGVLAAAGLVALETMTRRLVEDHDKIRRLAASLAAYPFLRLDPETVQTNILLLEVAHPRRSAADLAARLAERGVRIGAFGHRLRLVTHYDVRHDQIDQAIDIMADVFTRLD